MATNVEPLLGDEHSELGANAVIDRMKQIASVETDTALAKFVRTSRANVSKWRARNAVPYPEATFVALMRNASLDFILTGRGGRDLPFKGKAREIDLAVMERVIYGLYAFGLFELPDSKDEAADLKQLAMAVVFQYARGSALVERLSRESTLDAEQAEKAALAAMELMFSDGTLFGERYEVRPIKRKGDAKKD